MQLQLFHYGAAGIPTEHLRRERGPVALVVSPDSADRAVAAAEYLKNYRDGEIYVLAPNGNGELNQAEPPSRLVDGNFEVTLFIVNDGSKPLPNEVVAYLFKLRLRRVLSLNAIMELAEYSRPPVARSKVLFVSPGPIYPLSMGSHQRMFNCLLGLIGSGVDVSVLAQEQTPERSRVTQAALSLVATSVHFYKSSRGKLRGRPHWQRKSYDLLSKTLRIENPNKPSFSETCQQRSSFWLAKKLKELAAEGTYSAVWINYAWLMGKITPDLRRLFKVVICDTHDVHFYRNSSRRHWLDKVIFSDRVEKKAELTHLRRADLVIAISDRDGAILKQALPDRRVLTMPPTFEHLKAEVVARSVYKPLTFGFIGTKMEANSLALKYVLDEWWPTIHRFTPDSQFLVAGSVCDDPVVRKAAWLHDEVTMLGFVDDLEKFYRDIDVLLSPVLVKGGLNFKNAEAIVAGKHLFTNAAGAEALSPVPVKVAETAEDVIRLLREIEYDPQKDIEARSSAQSLALGRFGTLEIGPIMQMIQSGNGNEIQA